MKKFFRSLSVYLTVLSILVFGIGGTVAYLTPSELSVSKDSSITFCRFPVSLSYDNTAVSYDDNQNPQTDGTLMLFGSVPVKKITVNFTERRTVILGGQPFGIRLYADGLVVSQTTQVPTAYGNVNPASQAGILCGDILTAVNGIPLRTNEQLMQAVEDSGNTPIFLEFTRNGEKHSAKITPVMDQQLKEYRIGLWVRDSCAGIGTVTFTDPDNGAFAGLGHGIADSKSGTIMPLSEGDIVLASITSVQKSTGGCPGSLCGFFSDYHSIGSILANEDCGLFGKLYSPETSGEKIPLAFRQEVVRGDAKIYTTIQGSKPELYDVVIEDISYNNVNITKNMVICITDEKLLSAAGGIVQGMSGSPIIQNGKLVGAVTHVFINDPSHGYAIFAENMSEFSTTLMQKQKTIN